MRANIGAKRSVARGGRETKRSALEHNVTCKWNGISLIPYTWHMSNSNNLEI